MEAGLKKRVREWVQQGGRGGGNNKVGVGWGGWHMSRLVPLSACALMECKVTWKRPSFSLLLPDWDSSLVSVSKAPLSPLFSPTHNPSADFCSAPKSSHILKHTHTHSLSHVHAGLHKHNVQIHGLQTRLTRVKFPLKQEKWTETQTNTQKSHHPKTA